VPRRLCCGQPVGPSKKNTYQRPRKTIKKTKQNKTVSVCSNLTNPTLNIYYQLVSVFLPYFLYFESNLPRQCCLVCFSDSYVTGVAATITQELSLKRHVSAMICRQKIELDTCDLGKWLLMGFNLWLHLYFTDSSVNKFCYWDQFSRRSSRMTQVLYTLDILSYRNSKVKEKVNIDVKFGQDIFLR